MKVLIIGSGGREHALSWKCIQSSMVSKVYVAPGNAGTQIEDNIQNVAIDPENFAELSNFAQDNEIELTIVGPEQPLVDGICDYFESKHLKIFGPTKGAAQLEGSKSFTKDFLKRHKIPTAEYETFTELTSAIEYLKNSKFPTVIKADGLAAGKGVVIAENLPEAEKTVTDMLSGNEFGSAGKRVVIEEFLKGEEASFILIADGESFLPMATSQDHKRAFNGDKGPNTGGMGAYSPAPVVTEHVYQRIINEVIKPTLKGMKDEGNYYTGFLYAGLMITADGTPKVIEYNCRFGDPETQAIIPLLETDLLELLHASATGSLNEIEKIKWKNDYAMTVVMAASGYPKEYKKFTSINNLENLTLKKDEYLFDAGTMLKENKWLSNGGRVLNISSTGKDLKIIRESVHNIINQINWDEGYYRKDIGWRYIDE